MFDQEVQEALPRKMKACLQDCLTVTSARNPCLPACTYTRMGSGYASTLLDHCSTLALFDALLPNAS